MQWKKTLYNANLLDHHGNHVGQVIRQAYRTPGEPLRWWTAYGQTLTSCELVRLISDPDQEEMMRFVECEHHRLLTRQQELGPTGRLCDICGQDVGHQHQTAQAGQRCASCSWLWLPEDEKT